MNQSAKTLAAMLCGAATAVICSLTSTNGLISSIRNSSHRPERSGAWGRAWIRVTTPYAASCRAFR